ncbi:MAG: ferrous iron transporter B [Eubacteriales bacterium]|nr:ferrous iron transporter B [Eubacteriales bacterium]
MKVQKQIAACLAGCPNCGKTSLFNALTGMDMHVGNFPGVTVEKKTGKVKGTDNFYLTDLPGTYSLMPCSEDEKVACEYLKNGESDVIIAVCDGTNLQLGLGFIISIISIGKPTVAAINLMDEVKKRGGDINFRLLSSLLGIAVLPVSALKGEGINELKTAVATAASAVAASRPTIPAENSTPEYIRKRAEDIVKKVYRSPSPDRRSGKIDQILTGRYTAIPLFAVFMVLGFYLIFGLAGPWLSTLMQSMTNFIAEYIYNLLTLINVPELLKGLITEGIIGGVGAVMSFLPVISLLFLFLSLLEDTGYMARIAYIADRVFSASGLSGRAAVPLLIGFGCTVPAVMACRMLGTEKERRAVMRLLPFMSCPAKIPVYSLLGMIFFPGHTALAVSIIYLSGILFAAVYSALMKYRSKTRPPVFVMELPPYRLPSLKNTVRLMTEKSVEFIRRAFTVILIASATVWFLRSYNFTLSSCESGDSMLGDMGKLLAPLFAPLGFGSWQAVSAIITGLAAKEAAASTLILVAEGGVSALFTPLSAVSFMTFMLLYTPCAATLACIKKETGSVLFMLSVAVIQFIAAWVMAYTVYFLGRLL